MLIVMYSVIYVAFNRKIQNKLIDHIVYEMCVKLQSITYIQYVFPQNFNMIEKVINIELIILTNVNIFCKTKCRILLYSTSTIAKKNNCFFAFTYQLISSLYFYIIVSYLTYQSLTEMMCRKYFLV